MMWLSLGEIGGEMIDSVTDGKINLRKFHGRSSLTLIIFWHKK